MIISSTLFEYKKAIFKIRVANGWQIPNFPVYKTGKIPIKRELIGILFQLAYHCPNSNSYPVQ